MACQGRSRSFRVVAILPGMADDGETSQSLVNALNKLDGEVESDAFEYDVRQNVHPEAIPDVLNDILTEPPNLIIAHHPEYREALLTAVSLNPDQSFALWSDSVQPMDNLFVYNVRAVEPGYVNGRLAASLSKNQNLGIISTTSSPDMTDYIEGFRLGATSFNPDVGINVVQSENSTAVNDAQSMIEGGTDVFSGNLSPAVDLIIENELFWLGTYIDQRALSDRQVVVSQVYDWTVAFDEFLYYMQEEERAGGEFYPLTLENSGILMRYGAPYSNTVVRQFGDEGLFDVIDGFVDLP